MSRLVKTYRVIKTLTIIKIKNIKFLISFKYYSHKKNLFLVNTNAIEHCLCERTLHIIQIAYIVSYIFHLTISVKASSIVTSTMHIICAKYGSTIDIPFSFFNGHVEGRRQL